MKEIKKLLGMIALTAFVSQMTIMISQAQDTDDSSPVDLGKISCRELLKMPGDDKRLTLVFFHGFMNGKKNQMTFDRVALRDATDKVTEYCIDHPADTLISVFDKYR